MSTQDESPAILVLGDDTRSFLSVVRTFGRRNFKVDVCPFDFNSPALRSGYIRRIFHLPIYHLDPDRWVLDLKQIISRGAYRFILPCDDRTILPIIRHRDSFGDVSFGLPNDDAIRFFYDKLETRQLAQANGVPIAAGHVLEEGDTAESLVGEFGLPLVVKPRRSYVIDNVGVRNKVQIVHDIEALRAEIKADVGVSSRLVEQWLPGYGVGLAVLADQGRLVQAFEYHRVHEPRSGGGSSYRVSKPLNPMLVNFVEKMVAGAKLDGVAMFEFRFDPQTDVIILLEVNARFWGGLPLAIAAGIDFPWLLYRQSVLYEAVAATDYRTGYFVRNATADFYAVLETAGDLSWFRSVVFLVRTALAGAFRLVIFKEKFDSFAWADMSPFNAECKRIIGIFGVKLGHMAGFSPWWKVSRIRATVRFRLGGINGRRPRILFLCYGNICRSPFAERYLRAKLGDDIEVYSSGVHQEVERASPAEAVVCAEGWGVDLKPHRSSHIFDYADTPVDLVVLFDESNRENLLASGCLEGALVAKLGTFLSGPSAGSDIIDPYGHGPDSYRAVYGQIADAIDGLASMALKIPQNNHR